MAPQMPEPIRMSDAPRLFLITPRISDAAAFEPLLAAAVGATDIACVLIRTDARDEGDAKAIIKRLAPIAQARDAAVLVESDPRLAQRIDADGVHVSGTGSDLDDALSAMHQKKIVGVGALSGRDAAMEAGEAGVDYVMFGGPDGLDDAEAVLDKVSWWAEIFNVPCVGYAHGPDDAAPLAQVGAEFVALCGGLWDHPDAIATTLQAVALAILPIEEDAR
jgi:thiamine-phosphate pyrophosphorylase